MTKVVAVHVRHASKHEVTFSVEFASGDKFEGFLMPGSIDLDALGSVIAQKATEGRKVVPSPEKVTPYQEAVRDRFLAVAKNARSSPIPEEEPPNYNALVEAP